MISMQRIFPLLAVLLFSNPLARADEPARPNVLFIAVDDLRPQLNCYGHEQMVTPNMDALAQSGVQFNRAYCNVPTCGASRASLMTGLRPSRNRFVGWQARADHAAPDATTLNTHFKQHGYHTASYGKVFNDPQDSAAGWSTPAWHPGSGRAIGYQLPESRSIQAQNAPGRGPSYEAADVPDEAYVDAQIAQQGLEAMRRLARGDAPFFLAVGFFRPHLPFVAPQKYWDLYDPASIHLPANYHRPKDAPGQAIHSSGELRAYSDIPKTGPVSDETARKLIHGYYASVSFTDAQIGRLLDELEALGLADDTIVVLWSDHGWNLGEHTMWCKHSCFETSMQVPLVVRAPGVAGGEQTDALTDLIDVYPTLCDLAGLPKPEHLDGESFAARLENPDLSGKPFAIGRFNSGDTIRTDRFRFTEYTSPKGEFSARMLYDHKLDPSEDVNIAERSPQKETVGRLTEQLHRHMGRD